MAAMLLLSGTQLLLLGILGEYVGRIYEEVKQRPLYVVKGRVGIDAEDIAPRRQERQERQERQASDASPLYTGSKQESGAGSAPVR